MTETDYIVSLEDVSDRKAFFTALLAFFAPLQVVLTTWGRLPSEVQESLAPFRAPCSWARRHAFHQSNWHLTPQSLAALTGNLCDNDLLKNLTWGLIKCDTPFGRSLGWDDMILCGSDLIDDATLFGWLDDLRANGVLKSYEKIED